ncbi:phospholipase A(1) LCAT3 [Cucumis melo var. makuwa]|uniref:Phospholipase A(1) LCAT3 n=1 Tax=Cucumis melo var. makuwa TaxID=1194695 RepID=A0A5D3DJN1_CUCMM|nr:phospholipase A(1) LCAT3 [Cucumis melo var. makuwa]TYK23844.1 phospholipase A(1) LCAT3 [Cucumis melo var. makuwa]
MVGGGGCFLSLPFFGSRKSEPEPDRDPVLLVSGIGGSILHSKNKKLFGLQTRVWVRIFLSDIVFRENLISIYNPHTGPYSISFPIQS